MDTKTISWIEANLDTPSLQDIQTGELVISALLHSLLSIKSIKYSVLQEELKSNFDQVTVEIVQCPNLTAAPFHLKAPGLGGSTRILEIGGPPYLLPNVDRTRVYDLNQICRRAYEVDNPEGEFSAIGAGAGPWPLTKTNCEGVYNMRGCANKVSNGGRLVRIDNAEESPIVEVVPDNETRLPLLGNIFLSEGKPGQVR